MKNIEQTKQNIISGGIKNLHIIADFDGTLTKGFVNKIKSPSIIAELRNGNYLDEDYAKKAHALFDKYHPIEIDHNITQLERKNKMKEWWRTHFTLLIEKNLNISDVEKITESGSVELREGIKEFMEFLEKNNIPLIIMSASGIGDAVPIYLKKQGLLTNNVHIVSNFYEWDENGFAKKVKEPLIHSANKDEATLKSLPIYNELKTKKNVLLLGNGIGDLDMIKGFEYDNLLTIGFLHDDNKEKLELFKSLYDIVVENDGNLNIINELFKKIN